MPAPTQDQSQGPRPPAAPAPPEPARRTGARQAIVVAAAAVLALALAAVGQLARPLPDPSVRLALPARHTFGGPAPALPWPSRGQAAMDVEGLGTMGASGGAAPVPTASVAKVMTAYLFLREHPLRPGEAGPSYTISPQEAAMLPARKKRGESLVEVNPNQVFTEREALQALLVVSANNVAHEIARWSGGEAAFVQRMNATARRLGMTHTTYTDPSGYHPTTVSTAADQVKLLRAAMRLPAFAEIVAQRTYAPRTGEGVRPASNALLGRYGVVGGKTGYTDKAGGNYVFAARHRVGGVETMLVGAVMGQAPGAGATPALDAAGKLIAAGEGAMTSATLAAPGRTIATLNDGLGGREPLVSSAPLNVVGWPGLTVRLHAQGDPPHHAARDRRVGLLTAGPSGVPLTPRNAYGTPGPLDRLTRF